MGSAPANRWRVGARTVRPRAPARGPAAASAPRGGAAGSRVRPRAQRPPRRRHAERLLYARRLPGLPRHRLSRRTASPSSRSAASSPCCVTPGLPIVWLNWGVRPDLLNTSPSLLHAHAPDGTGAGLGDTIPGGAPILVEGGWGAQIVDELVPDAGDIQVTKYRLQRVLGHAARHDPAQPRRDDAVLRGRQRGPVRDDDAAGRDVPRLRLRHDRGLRGDDVAGLLHGGDALQREAAVRVRHAARRRCAPGVG